MQFSRTGSVYKVARITGAQNNLLGIVLAPSQVATRVGDFDGEERSELSEKDMEVLRQVEQGIAEANARLGAEFSISKIMYLANESTMNSVYKLLTIELLHRVHAGELPK